MRKALTDRGLRSMTEDTTDTVVPGLGVRVSAETGRKTFVLTARFGGSKHPARRTIGVYGDITLEQARETARHWRALIRQGKDPAGEAKREREAKIRERAITFGAVFEDWKREKLAHERRGLKAQRDVERDFLPLWADWPIADITDDDIRAAVRKVAVRGKYQAFNSLSHVRRMFGWAVDQGRAVYGLTHSPAERLRPKNLIGVKKPRARVLSDTEIRAYCRAAKGLPYPYGPQLQLLLMTGARHMEVAGMRWREIDKQARVWTVPAERFKSNAEHRVPLTDDVLALLETLPRFRKGDCLFTSSFGANPTPISDQIKKKLDRRMLRSLQEAARRRGEDPEQVQLRPWVLHDLRRVVRSHLAALQVQDHVAEMCVGHGRKGIARVYDRHRYDAEVGRAFDAWAARLRSIVAPPPPRSADVIQIGSRMR
jgi:integrase